GLHLVNALGEEKIHQGPGGSAELTANLGIEAAVQLRWRLHDTSDVTGDVEVREAYFWDLRPGAMSVAAALQFVPVKGAPSRLTLLLPEELEVRSLEATSANPIMAAVPVTILKNWHVTGQGPDRRLHIELSGPMVNPLQLFLSLAPKIHLAEGNVAL